MTNNKDFTEADVERGNIAGFTRKTVQDVLSATAPAMRDRWRQELADKFDTTDYIENYSDWIRSGGDQ